MALTGGKPSSVLLSEICEGIVLPAIRALYCLGLNLHTSSLAAVFCTLNSTSGAYYHIGYPAIARIAFGMNGSYFAILNRILLSVVWCEGPLISDLVTY